MTFLRKLFRFWYDFLVGDRWELFLGPIAALVVVGAAVAAGIGSAMSGVLLFALIALVAAFSVAWAVR
jgi:hypothetical protein